MDSLHTTSPHTTTPQTAPASRMPDPQHMVPELADIGAALYRATGNRSVPRTTIGLIQLRAGQIVGNTYLTIMHTTSLRKAGESEERIAAVASWRDAPYFTGPERAALALLEAVIQPSAQGERVTNALYAEVRAHYDDKALATLALAIGQVNFFIPLAVIGKPLPGRKPTEQWT
ncbi:carboxymuconolactone decarboxylase family protein [Streptomyces sp. NPDC058613]|uniref:carboxymuconolactone decarboxylase family protein n=1 Tax=unclassified Streptomyces TaxID=2593676 RepID=UPI003657213B